MKCSLDPNIVSYIEREIMPLYARNEEAHGKVHIRVVIQRSLEFMQQVTDQELDPNMVVVVAAFHDLGHHIDRNKHEKISADILRNDRVINDIFSDEDVETMAQAIEDHRASSDHEPRSIYGRIVSSADRSYNIEDFLRRSYIYNQKHHQDKTFDEIVEQVMSHTTAKYGENGYAKSKMYFADGDFNLFCEKMQGLCKSPMLFKAALYKAIQDL